MSGMRRSPYLGMRIARFPAPNFVLTETTPFAMLMLSACWLPANTFEVQAAVIDPRTPYSHIRVFSLDCPLISHHVSACSRMDVMDVDG
ncbi:uncharacterized protein BDZ83DRAFT_278165 [Colletotrichum acutatum]|uniref:Uncharacterized protein n=1 Tax=Glomerella acutata TaxID=27357 RepID=A0AAD8UM23_GLOAC|nr:uncharacterized protein BDZ83DRAFT_278165 [Colletotrichum acutatum]KAK1725853.1 hypothetical protein BDZ83DRAFT_278165 [Colletotrichum acutatum]